MFSLHVKNEIFLLNASWAMAILILISPVRYFRYIGIIMAIPRTKFFEVTRNINLNLIWSDSSRSISGIEKPYRKNIIFDGDNLEGQNIDADE